MNTLYTYAIQRKKSGQFLAGRKALADRKPRETFDLSKAIHRKTARLALEAAKCELGGNVKHFQIVKIAHQLSVVED